jgi:hypothetical protein
VAVQLRPQAGELQAGACIFAGLDGLLRTQTMAVMALWDELAHHGMRLLNDPRRGQGPLRSSIRRQTPPSPVKAALFAAAGQLARLPRRQP